MPWYTPYWSQSAASWDMTPVVADTWGVSLLLVNPDGPGVDQLGETAIRVTRVVGQYRLRTNGGAGWNGTPTDQFPCTFHHRVYPVSGDGTNFFLRRLYNDEDADSDWMWHQVDEFDWEGAAQNDSTIQPGRQGWLSKAENGSTSMVRPFQTGRFGHFDIKVDRRIDEGEGLVWRTEIDNQTAPQLLPHAGATEIRWYLDLWIRLFLWRKVR